MALKSLLVALDATESSSAAMRAAVAFASAHGAHLIGLHVVDIPPMPSYMSVEIPDELHGIQRKHYLEIAAGIEAAFREACAAAGIEGEWRCADGRTGTVVETHARYVDLLCVRAPGESAPGHADAALPEELILSAGKPVLVCPSEFRGGAVGEYVTIAWNASREAARAVNDAMSILERAKKVSVVAVSTDAAEPVLGPVPGSDLSHYLARHGVNAEAQDVQARGKPVGDVLLEWAKGQGADLMVMGAYGHSRFREILLGGATRRILQKTHIPVLMSH